MGQRVLVLDNDREFAAKVRDALASRGAAVEIAESAQAGITRATAVAPDLIVLSVELPDKNGFLVCKTLKKTPSLKSVPVVIVSGDENADEIFEQHRKLKTRANEYLRKPIDMGGFVERVGQLIPLAESANGDRSVDEEIDAFADNAFNALVMGQSTKGVAMSADEEDVVEVEMDEVVMVDAPSERPTGRAVSPVISELPPSAGSGKPGAGAAVSSREFLDMREALNSKERELLDLRDQLGARDKQILDLNEQSLKQARAQADFEDQLLEIQGKLQESDQLVARLTADHESATKRAEDLKGRFERADDKARRLEEELNQERDGREAEMATLRSQQEQALTSLRQEQDEALTLAKAEAKAAVAQAAEEREHALQGLREELKREQSAAVAAAQAAAEAANGEALTRLREELESVTVARISEVEDSWERRVIAREEELEAQKRAALEEAEAENSKQMATLGRKISETEEQVVALTQRAETAEENAMTLESQLASARDEAETLTVKVNDLEEHGRQLQAELDSVTEARDRAQSELDSTRMTVDSLENANREHESRAASMQAVKDELEARLSAAMAKAATDDAVMQRVHKALAIGLGLLEQHREADVVEAIEDHEMLEDAE